MKHKIPAAHRLLPILLLCALLTLAGCKDSISTTVPGTGTLTTGTSGSTPSTADPADITDPPAEDYDPSLYVVIRTAEDLMAFGRAVNRDGYDFGGMTVIFLSDVDMEGYTWSPLDGRRLEGVTFDGRGNTLRNLTFADYEYPADNPPDESRKGCGLVDVATGDLIFRDLTLEGSLVRAYDHAVGNFLGSVQGGHVTFEGCRSVGFTVEGWVDWFHRDPAEGGHAVALRMGGFIGYLGSGTVRFTSCAVEELTLTGFHNLAGFVGYDGTGTLTAEAFRGCTVTGADLRFAYCLSESFTPDQPEKFVSVFFNGVDWRDNLDSCTAAGNGYAEVIYTDLANDGAVYTPEAFRSYTSKEADEHA